MFARIAISATAAITALGATPAAAEVAAIDLAGLGAVEQAVRQEARGIVRTRRAEPRPRVERSCRRGDAASLLGAIAGGLSGRQMGFAPDPRSARAGRRDCR